MIAFHYLEIFYDPGIKRFRLLPEFFLYQLSDVLHCFFPIDQRPHKSPHIIQMYFRKAWFSKNLLGNGVKYAAILNLQNHTFFKIRMPAKLLVFFRNQVQIVYL